MHRSGSSRAVVKSGKMYVFFLVNLYGLALNVDGTERKNTSFRFTVFVLRKRKTRQEETEVW